MSSLANRIARAEALVGPPRGAPEESGPDRVAEVLARFPEIRSEIGAAPDLDSVSMILRGNPAVRDEIRARMIEEVQERRGRSEEAIPRVA